MLITNLAATDQFLRKNMGATGPLRRWIDATEQAEWHSILDVRQTFRHADAIKGTNLTCFNIAGNNFRLITIVRYDLQEVFVIELLTHAQYNRKYT